MGCSLVWGRGTTGITAILAGTAEAITVVVTMAADFMDEAGAMTASEAADLTMKDSAAAVDSMAVKGFVEAAASAVEKGTTVGADSTVAVDFMVVAAMAGTDN